MTVKFTINGVTVEAKRGESVTYTCTPLDGTVDLTAACSGTVALLDETDRLSAPAPPPNLQYPVSVEAPCFNVVSSF